MIDELTLAVALVVSLGALWALLRARRDLDAHARDRAVRRRLGLRP